jgi:hypothetical protein
LKPIARARVTALLSGAFLVLVSVVAQPAASAAPATANLICYSRPQDPNGAYAFCGHMQIGERVRAVVKCDGFWSDYVRRGPWRTESNQRSVIYCDDSGDDRIDHWYDWAVDV